MGSDHLQRKQSVSKMGARGGQGAVGRGTARCSWTALQPRVGVLHSVIPGIRAERKGREWGMCRGSLGMANGTELGRASAEKAPMEGGLSASCLGKWGCAAPRPTLVLPHEALLVNGDVRGQRTAGFGVLLPETSHLLLGCGGHRDNAAKEEGVGQLCTSGCQNAATTQQQHTYGGGRR